MNKKGTVVLVVVVISLAICLSGLAAWLLSQETAEGVYEAALLKKEAEGDLQGAIQLFQKILKTYPEKREVAAKAQFQIGACYEKLGTAEAIKAYELVLKNYADQPELVAAARERLAALRQGIAPDPSVVPLPQVEENFWPRDLSPDGTKLLGVEEDEGNNIVYLDIPSGKIVPLTRFNWSPESLQTSSPVWSPDGKEIAYQQRPNDQTARKCDLIVSKIGGESRVLYSTDDGNLWPCDWPRSGGAIVAVWKHRDNSISLGLVPPRGGPFKHLCSIHDYVPFSVPKASPDGRFIVFEEGRPNAGKIKVVDVESGTASLLTDHPADEKDPRWSPDGKHIVYLSTRLGRWGLWGTAMQDGRAIREPFMIRDGMADMTLFNWTTAGLAWAKWIQSNDIYIQSIDPLTYKLIDKPRLLSNAPAGKNSSPRWSPDGKSLAFLSCAGGPPTEVRVVVFGLENGKIREYATPLSRTFSFTDYLTWLPDGSGIVFASVMWQDVKESPLAFFRLDLASREWSPLSFPGFFVDYGRDVHSVFYGLDADRTADPGIIERNLGTGEERHIYRAEKSEAGEVLGLRFSRDFRKLVFLIWTSSESGGYYYRLRTLDLESGQIRTIFSGSDEPGSPSWSPDGQHILAYCGDSSDWSKGIALIPAGGGPMQKLDIDMSWPAGAGLYGRFTSVDWSPDGTKIALSVWSSIEQEYILRDVIPASQKK